MNTIADLELGTVHQGDCISGMQSLPEGSINLVFADPPFNIGYEYDEYDDRVESEKYLAWSADWMREVHRILDDSGAFWLAIGDEYAAELKIEAQKLGFHTRSWVVWYYTFGVHCKNKFTRSHAHLFHFVKNPKKFTFHPAEIAVPSARQLVYGDKRANPKGRMPDDTWILRPQDCVDGFTPDEDCWYFPRVAGTFKERAGFHGCQMPEQLLGRIIRSCSNADDVVLDPFSGSCTTLAAAKKLGRQFLGFEMSKEYAKLGKQRLEAIRSGDRLDGSPEPKASAPATYSDKARRLGSTPSDRKGFVHLEFDFETFSGQEDALVAAFANANRGFSVDRVIADPTLNQSFQNQCEKLAVQGTPAERNRMLFRLRHAGELKRPDVEMSKVTKLDWSEVDRFLFGSEIAWRKLIDLHDGLTLDELFADPNHAAEFDTLASAVAPGATPLQYRWAAIMLRKQLATFSDSFAAGEDSASHVDALADGPVPDEFQSLSTFELEGVPTTPGVYLLRHGEERWLFAGETMNLRARLSVQLAPEARLNWPADRQSEADVFVSFVAYPSETRLADQVRLVKQFRPEWNLPVD